MINPEVESPGERSSIETTRKDVCSIYSGPAVGNLCIMHLSKRGRGMGGSSGVVRVQNLHEYVL